MRRWVVTLLDSGGNLDLNDLPRPGRRFSSSNDFKRQIFHEIIQENRRHPLGLREDRKEAGKLLNRVR
jgi:hypothetical protein